MKTYEISNQLKKIFTVIKIWVIKILKILFTIFVILVLIIIFSILDTKKVSDKTKIENKTNIIENSKIIENKKENISVDYDLVSEILTKKYFTDLKPNTILEIEFDFILIRKVDGIEEYTLYIPYNLNIEENKENQEVKVTKVKVPKNAKIELIKSDNNKIKISKSEEDNYILKIYFSNDSLKFIN